MINRTSTSNNVSTGTFIAGVGTDDEIALCRADLPICVSVPLKRANDTFCTVRIDGEIVSNFSSKVKVDVGTSKVGIRHHPLEFFLCFAWC